MSKKKGKPSIEETLKNTHRFLQIQLVTLHFCWNDYKALFGYSKERVDLLNRCAGSYFLKVQFAMLQQLELSIVRLLDPPRQGKNNNLTFPMLVEMSAEVLGAEKVLGLKYKLEQAHGCSKEALGNKPASQGSGPQMLGIDHRSAGEEPAFRVGVVRIVGGSVLRIEIAPVTGRMTIEQPDDHLMGDVSRNSGRGHDSSEGVTHSERRGRRDGPAAHRQ